MAKLRETCASCGKPFTNAEMLVRKQERIANAFRSRAKAAANGRPVKRRRSFDWSFAKKMVNEGAEVWEVAEIFGVSESAIYRALKAVS